MGSTIAGIWVFALAPARSIVPKDFSKFLKLPDHLAAKGMENNIQTDESTSILK